MALVSTPALDKAVRSEVVSNDPSRSRANSRRGMVSIFSEGDVRLEKRRLFGHNSEDVSKRQRQKQVTGMKRSSKVVEAILK